VYIGSFSAGMGAMPWVVMSEVNSIPEGQLLAVVVVT